MADVVCQQGYHGYGNGTLRVQTTQNDIGDKVETVWHQHHSETDTDDSIEVDKLASPAIGQVAKDRRNKYLDKDVKANDNGILIILDFIFLFDVEFLLEEHGLEGVDAHKNEGKHEVVSEAAQEVAALDPAVQADPVEAGFLTCSLH